MSKKLTKKQIIKQMHHDPNYLAGEKAWKQIKKYSKEFFGTIGDDDDQNTQDSFYRTIACYLYLKQLCGGNSIDNSFDEMFSYFLVPKKDNEGNTLLDIDLNNLGQFAQFKEFK